MRCSALSVFILLENYGYGHLYGVRVAKYGTGRMMLCTECRDGYTLDRNQWEQAKLVAQGLKRRAQELSLSEMAESAVELARKIFPDLADDVRTMLWEQLGDPPPEDESSEGDLAGAMAAIEAADDTKICPDCAEEVKAAARKCRFCGYRFAPEEQAQLEM
jgi:hypothetical protein